MDLAAVENKLYDIKELIELAMVEHPEDYNLGQCFYLIEELIIEVE